jgi:LysR family transcriptional regulator, hydrogen peroxide-inducible genes activator
MLTLRQLRYLDALARHGHFGRAAEECSVSQPALSMQINELEKELGAKLVEHLQGVTVLTEIGREVARRAADILSAARDLADSARSSAHPLSGPLHLGIIPTLAPYVLPRILPELQRRYPELRLELIESQTRTLLGELRRGALDVLLLALPVDQADLETLQLFEDYFLLAVPADDPLPERSRVCTRDVDARRLILATACAIRPSHTARNAAPPIRVSARPASPPSCKWWQAATELRSCGGRGRRRGARRAHQVAALC